MKKLQEKFYTELLKDGEILLLKSSDSFFDSHYTSSPLNIMTNFSGTAGEAVIDKKGHIVFFADTRYHKLVDKQLFSGIEVIKMPLGESFSKAFKKRFKKGTVLHLPKDIKLKKYMDFDNWFDLRTYSLNRKFQKNDDFNKNSPLFLCSRAVEKNSFLYKISKLKSIFPNINYLLVFNLDEIAYLTNIRSFQAKYSSLFRSILLINFKEKKHILFVDKLPDFKINGLKFMKLSGYKSVIKSIDQPIYLDSSRVTLENFLVIKKPKEIKNNNLPLIASIKTKSEIEYIESCARKTDLAIYNFKKRIKEGLSEYTLSEIFEEELLKTGACGLSFKTILAIGENSASIHYSDPDKNKLLKKENIILLDCGGYWGNGFATDITRTFYFGSSPLPIHKTIYTNVLKAFIAKETNAKKVDEIARKMLSPFEKQGFNFNHGLGHGIGTSVHQNPPVLSILSEDIIKPDHPHSIEPGLYGGKEVKFGVRLENCVWSDLEGKRYTLTKFPFEEVLIDYSLLDKDEKEFINNWQNSFKAEEKE